MNAREALKKEVEQLVNDSGDLIELSRNEDNFGQFSSKYHVWYTKALRVVLTLAADRLEEFRNYYNIDPKRRVFSSSTYVIQDYLRGTGAHRDIYETPRWDVNRTVAILIFNQSNIIKSLQSRVEGVLSNIEGGLLADIQDAELGMAEKLKKVNLRAAGALAGVVLEDHLQRVAAHHKIKILKRNPTVSDLNDPLKQSGIYETPSWRKIQFLADLRNLCAHKEEREPTLEEVNELVEGVNWVVKNIS